MAKNRSRRLRKKLCVDEFQELGFEVQVVYRSPCQMKLLRLFSPILLLRLLSVMAWV
jgi:hypothetical protein